MQAVVTLGVFVWAIEARSLGEARNIAFSVLVFGELFRAFAARSPTRLFFETDVLSNVVLLLVVSLSATVQMVVHHLPLSQHLFDIGVLSFADGMLSLGLGLIPATWIEIVKLVGRWRTGSAAHGR